MPNERIADKDIPELARRCWQQYQEATQDVRKESVESLKMWLGGEHQWRPAEIAARRGANRPFLSINRLKPVVDQVENEARGNPPGPQAHPVGGGADKDGGDILCGLIREYEYRSDAQRSYCTALRYAMAGNYGAFELATEFVAERSFEQQLIVKEIEDPAMLFVDPNARRACREDAMWSGKIRVLTREQVIEEFGPRLKILNPSTVDMAGGAAGWMQSALGWRGDQATINLWTGGAQRRGPFYVCDFYRVVIEEDTLTLYDDFVARFDDEPAPAGVKPQFEDGEPVTRKQGRRKVVKYCLTALDVITKTEWLGDIIPIFWVLGPEIYIDGKLHRLSLIDNAGDSQRGLNYAATGAVETVSFMTKAPWMGAKGSFDVGNAQGIRPWDNANVMPYSYLEYEPVFAINQATGEATLMPPPQRNAVEAPIARLLELCNFFIESIKGATAIFFDPSIQSARDAQSGEAIKALQAQSNIGTINWQDALHRAVTFSYQQAAEILPQLYDGERVKTIVRADAQHEIVTINQEFNEKIHAYGDGGLVIDRKTGKPTKRNTIALGKYSLRVTAGPNAQTRTENSIAALTEVFKIAPQLLGSPGVAAQFLRMVGEGSPQVEQMADMLSGQVQGDMTPQQMQAQLLQLKQSDQLKTQLLQKASQALQAKLPDIEAKKWIAALDSVTKIEVAKVNASQDRDSQAADILASHFEQVLGMAHDSAAQAADHQHAQAAQAADQAHASASQASDQAAAEQSQQSSQDAAAQQQAQQAEQDSQAHESGVE